MNLVKIHRTFFELCDSYFNWCRFNLEEVVIVNFSLFCSPKSRNWDERVSLAFMAMVRNDGLKVDEMFNDVADILPGREDVQIKVRVLRLWKVSAFLNPIETSSIEMILVDEKSDRESWRIKVKVLMI